MAHLCFVLATLCCMRSFCHQGPSAGMMKGWGQQMVTQPAQLRTRLCLRLRFLSHLKRGMCVCWPFSPCAAESGINTFDFAVGRDSWDNAHCTATESFLPKVVHRGDT